MADEVRPDAAADTGGSPREPWSHGLRRSGGSSRERHRGVPIIAPTTTPTISQSTVCSSITMAQWSVNVLSMAVAVTVAPPGEVIVSSDAAMTMLVTSGFEVVAEYLRLRFRIGEVGRDVAREL